MKKLIASMITATVALTSFSLTACAEEKEIFIIGDSTACEYGNDDNYAIPRAGWGMYLDKYTADDIKVVDLALSGRSSKSFTTEDNYKTFLSEVGEGDYVLIQFGHNDSKNTKEEDIQLRYTDPEGDKDTEGSFKNSLYKNYIVPTREKGATPVLLTPITRRNFDENGKVTDNHGLYDDAIRELAKEENILLIDMTANTAELYNMLGEDEAMYLHAVYNDREKGKNGIDNTHLNHFGGDYIAHMTAMYLSDEGLTNADVFDMTPLTRGEFTKALMRALQLDAEAGENFGDVDPNADYAEAVAKAKALHIVYGDENAVFDGERLVSADEMALMAERALKAAGVYMPEIAGEDMAACVLIAKGNIAAAGIEIDPENTVWGEKGLKNVDCYKVLTDCYNALTDYKNYESEKEQSIDEIEKTEEVVLTK